MGTAHAIHRSGDQGNKPLAGPLCLSRLIAMFRYFICCISLSLSVSLSGQPDPLNVSLSNYSPSEQLTAEVNDDTLTVRWNGMDAERLRVKFVVLRGRPTVAELAARSSATEPWRVLGRNLQPEYRIVTGVRRVTMQQTEPLEAMGVPLTENKLNEIKWDAFWDAPLYLSDEPPLSHQSSLPAREAFANHPGMPRDSSEVERTVASFAADSCRVVSDGARLTITFPGASAGTFTGYLQYDIFPGTGLLRQMLVARTEAPSVAFKYAAGLSGLPLDAGNRIVWRDLSHQTQAYRLGGPVDDQPVRLLTANRLLVAELNGGSLAAFPPPHSFYWARESEQNLGYGWYQKDAGSFSFGVRQADGEQDPEFYQNFALYSARPGTWQRMPVFFEMTATPAPEALDRALAYTNGDRFRRLEGYRVMGHHYHVGLVDRLRKAGSFDQRINDVATMQGIGMDIYSIIDGARGPGRKDTAELYLQDLHDYYEAARRQSDRGFLVMPSDENSTGGRRPFMGGHYELIMSHPIYWRPARAPGVPLYEDHPKYGTVYNLGTPQDMMAMTEREGVIINMAHPNAKRSTGFPMAVWDEPHFQHPNYFGLGYRWGMGIDASEIRLGEYRFQKLWDETNNYLTSRGHDPKFALAISEARSDLGDRGKPPFDDAYGMSPVNYLRIDTVPSVDDTSPIVAALSSGEYFVTSGEVLLPEFRIEGEGEQRTAVAQVKWTFPLEFVELVWGDGERTDRQILKTSELGAFGEKTFRIPFTVGDKLWIRFAAWDVATNGAMTQVTKF